MHTKEEIDCIPTQEKCVILISLNISVSFSFNLFIDQFIHSIFHWCHTVTESFALTMSLWLSASWRSFRREVEFKSVQRTHRQYHGFTIMNWYGISWKENKESTFIGVRVWCQNTILKLHDTFYILMWSLWFQFQFLVCGHIFGEHNAGKLLLIFNFQFDLFPNIVAVILDHGEAWKHVCQHRMNWFADTSGLVLWILSLWSSSISWIRIPVSNQSDSHF